MHRSVPGNPTLVVAMISLILLAGIYTHPTIPSCIATHVVHHTQNPPSCALLCLWVLSLRDNTHTGTIRIGIQTMGCPGPLIQTIYP